MSRLEDLMIAAILLIAALFVGWIGIEHYGATRYQDGYAAAVHIGQEQHDRDAAAARKTETDLRAQLAAKDEEAQESERTYEISLEVAQRRVRDGTDRLRCPAASPIQHPAAASDRPATPGPAADGTGPDLVPEAAADVLGLAADVAGLVRRYERLEERFDACREVNAK